MSRRSIRIDSAEKLSKRIRRLDVGVEVIAACCNLSKGTVESALAGREPIPFSLRAFVSLYGGTSIDARAAVKRAALEATQETETLWRPIPGYERYEVSNHGDVRRVAGGAGSMAGLRLKHRITPSRHHLVTVYDANGKMYRTGVHRLVALAFIGASPEGKPLVCHNDGDPENNTPDNLRWGSHADNIADMMRHRRERRSVDFPRNTKRRALLVKTNQQLTEKRHFLGKGEVDSSILSGSTTPTP